MNNFMDTPVLTKAEIAKDYEDYLNSSEWKEILKKAETAINQNYTIIYRDGDGDLKEAWHYLSDMNIEYVKEKYKKEKKQIYHFVLKKLPFGEYLKTITGNSKNSR